jgi:hypothetical protein
MPSKEPEKRGFIQVDGDTWILEVADERRHHVAARWYHEDYPDFAAACYCMLEWSGLRQTLDDIEGYGFGARQRLISRCARR